MTFSSTPEFNNPKNTDPDFKSRMDRDSIPAALSNDPDYIKLLELYQSGEFAKCQDVLLELEERYPEQPGLKKFRDDLEMKLSLKKITVKSIKSQKRKKAKSTLNLTAFAIVGTIIVLVAFFFSFYYFNEQAAADRLAQESAQLASLNSQAEQLLRVGKPQAANEIVEIIRSIDPAYENLSALVERTNSLLGLEAQYQVAVGLMAEDRVEDALLIFRQIEAEEPGMWDVGQQIEAIETSNLITGYLEEGAAAFQEGNWDVVINSYEKAMLLNPQLDDPLMKEQLVKGYLNKIIDMLQDQETSIEDIETAEDYYRKAVALIPQSKEFATERENLQELSSNLLEAKYTQTAKALLADKNQNVTTIARAVAYMRKAANIDPKNTALQLDLKNAEAYQVAFQDIVEMKWMPAITSLTQIMAADSNYADGNARLLLFEAYYALGKQYYSAGFYQDARNNLEQAEFLAWDNNENLMKLFQVQTLLGDTIGKTKDFENAVSYYQYALEAIQALTRLVNHPDLATQYNEAIYLASIGSYEQAYFEFQGVIENINVIYTVSEYTINDGACLIFFADEHFSTVDAVLEANSLPENMIINFGRDLLVPVIEN